MARRALTIAAVFTGVMMMGPAALACGGLIGPNGAVNLLRTSTLAGYTDGVEHYITSFEFGGAGTESFGSIVPLPDVPDKVERGGDWTLQRLQREVTPEQPRAAFSALSAGSAEDSAEVLLETKIDSLDITVLRGGAKQVVDWAEGNGFTLSPDAPEVLDFYAKRSPIFMAAKFDVADAQKRGFSAGDGTPIHVQIPTDNPWVPLRILALGKQPAEFVQADVFLLTDNEPVTLPAPLGKEGSLVAPGMRLGRSERASESLMDDLRSDKGGDWIGRDPMWLTFLQIDAPAKDIGFDLAIDASGSGTPSPVDAGLTSGLKAATREAFDANPLLIALSMTALLAVFINRRRAVEA